MQNSLQLLDARIHRTHGYKPYESMPFAANDVCTPILLDELIYTLPHFPLVFIKYESSEHYQLNALLGLENGNNLFVNSQGKWLSGVYVPSSYRSYPFILKTAMVDNEQRGMICFDRDSGLYREYPDSKQGDVRFFDDEGKLQPTLQNLVTFFSKFKGNQKLTQIAVDSLDAANLIEPWDLIQGKPVANGPLINGLYRINETALNGLDGNNLKELQITHALPIAYTQLFSMQRTIPLIKMHQMKNPTSLLSQRGGTVDALFGEDDKDEMKFDWSNL